MPASGSIPDDYREILYWSLTQKSSQLIALQIVGTALFAAFGLIFFAIAAGLGYLPSPLTFGISEIGALLAGIVLTLIFHELVHALIMRMFGAKPTFGVLWKKGMLYTTTSGFAFRRNHYVAIALAPLFVLSVVVILGMWLLNGTFWVAVFALCGAINASGAIGDMWMTLIVLRYSPAAYVVDERDGIRVFLRNMNPEHVNH